MDKLHKIENANNILKNKGNIIKTIDDRELILVNQDGNVQNKEDCSWTPEKDKKVNNKIFRTRIEPWLTSLFQSEHLSLLCGSGITNAISYLARASAGATMGTTTFAHFKDEIEEAAKISAKASGREDGNIEDQIRTAFDLLRGLKILKRTKEAEELESDLNSVITDFAKSILATENAIATATEIKRTLPHIQNDSKRNQYLPRWYLLRSDRWQTDSSKQKN